MHNKPRRPYHLFAYHFQEGLDPRPDLAGIAFRKIRFQLHVMEAEFVCDEAFHQGGLYIEGVAGLQDRINDAIDPVLFYRPAHQIEAAGIGAHAGAGDGEGAFGQGREWISLFRHEAVKGLDALHAS